MVELWKLAMCLTAACGQLVTLGMDATEVPEECVQAARDWSLIHPEKRFICKGTIAGSPSLWIRQIIVGSGGYVAVRHSQPPRPYQRYLESRAETEQALALRSPEPTPPWLPASVAAPAIPGQPGANLEKLQRNEALAPLASTVPGMLIVDGFATPLEQSKNGNTARTRFDDIDSDFQRVPSWQLIRLEFPHWYQEHLEEAARLQSERRERGFVARRLEQALAALRRQHAQDALAASPAALRQIAETFLGNLQLLSSQSVQACYGFISQGETSPHVIELMRTPEHAEVLQRQVTAVFRAIVEGRRSPRAYTPPQQSDYQLLSTELTKRGWTEKDVLLFSNPRQLAQAPPEEVCRLVKDWFAAQLSITDEESQLRLLRESLTPVVSG